MKHRSPLLTLAAVALYFVAMLVANSVVHPSGAAAGGGGAGSGSGTTSTAPPSQPADDSDVPDASEFAGRVGYAGPTEDDDLVVAVAVLRTQAVAFVCDGIRVATWLRGTVDGDKVALTGSDGTTIKARLDDGMLEGDVDLGDDSFDFAIREMRPPAGLYRARGPTTTVGWIVLADGSQVGLATDNQGGPAPAPRLDPQAESVEVDGEQVSPERINGDADI